MESPEHEELYKITIVDVWHSAWDGDLAVLSELWSTLDDKQRKAFFAKYRTSKLRYKRHVVTRAFLAEQRKLCCPVKRQTNKYSLIRELTSLGIVVAV
jgi:hypothetical protein